MAKHLHNIGASETEDFIFYSDSDVQFTSDEFNLESTVILTVSQ
jgi:hypothetical protein